MIGMKCFRYIGYVFMLLVLPAITVVGQINPKDACRIEDGRLVFRLDLLWSSSQKREFVQLFDLDSTVMAGVYAGKTEIVSKGIVWKTKKLTIRIVELSKSLSSTPENSPLPGDVVMVDDEQAGYMIEAQRESSPYGVNKFTRYSVFQYIDGCARFYLPGHTDVNQVYISGTFNRWSTIQMPMQRSDSGWTIRLKLKPGKYLYKYILDGNWTSDPFNRLWGRDGYIEDNSVVYCYNYFFTLKGKTDAKAVYVTGSFNQWNRKELKMFKTRYGWALPLYLREGTHAYKFIVDGEYIPDPGNKVVRQDGSGNYNSIIGIGEPIFFTLKGYKNASKVIVSGNFNAWNQLELSMNRTSEGWRLPYVLAPGNYEYKFIVDGKWMTDPGNPFKTGHGEIENSILVVQPNYTFKLDQSTDAKSVIVSGSFNGWNKSGYKMAIVNHQWTFPVRLKPGKYTYKFVVDNKWILDPGNDLWEENEYGTGNSVLWIEP